MQQNTRWLSGLAIAVVAIVILLAFGVGRGGGGVFAEIPYTTFKKLVQSGEVAEITFYGRAMRGVLKRPRPIGPNKTEVERFRVRVPVFGDPKLLEALDKAGVTYSVARGDGEPTAGGVFLSLLPWLFLIALYWWFWRRASGNVPGGLGGQGGINKFLEGTSKTEQPDDENKVTFEDVAGQENAKREVAELVEFLRDPQRFTRLGAEVPHGVLLVGPPGTGKTLLARALAGEAGVPFFSISASEFIEVFVGVGASRVRHMFAEAKRRAPSIIFIDELDAVGRVRGTGLGGGNDEREQTLNQILSEMDGFGGHEAVIVLAATNRPDVLDPALLRPGRFDRHVTLELPDQQARRAILAVHVRKVPLDKDIDLDTIAAGTPGFSGADLKNLVNEAAMLAARDDCDRVGARHFDEAREKVIMGAVRSLVIEPAERHRLAVHESGHTVVAHFLPHTDPLYKVTIIPRGRALGATLQLPEEERYTLPEEYLRDRLAVMLGGRAAEKTLLHSVSSGADDDIKQATALARAMIGRWGMSDTVGPVDVRESEEHPFLGREMAQPRRFSEATARQVDEAVHDLLTDAENRATEVIAKHRARMNRLVAALEEKETLERNQIEDVLGKAHPHKETPRRASTG
jgi:cell division protease FtsH